VCAYKAPWTRDRDPLGFSAREGDGCRARDRDYWCHGIAYIPALQIERDIKPSRERSGKAERETEHNSEREWRGEKMREKPCQGRKPGREIDREREPERACVCV
jgi:hypothetical protein